MLTEHRQFRGVSAVSREKTFDKYRPGFSLLCTFQRLAGQQSLLPKRLCNHRKRNEPLKQVSPPVWPSRLSNPLASLAFGFAFSRPSLSALILGVPSIPSRARLTPPPPRSLAALAREATFTQTIFSHFEGWGGNDSLTYLGQIGGVCRVGCWLAFKVEEERKRLCPIPKIPRPYCAKRSVSSAVRWRWGRREAGDMQSGEAEPHQTQPVKKQSTRTQ